MSSVHLNIPNPHNQPEKATPEGQNKFIGFWLYIAAESVLFSTFFGTYLGLKNATGSGPTADELFHLPMVFIATVILLTSSLTSVFAITAMHRGKAGVMKIWFLVSLLLGVSFLGLEIYEFGEYVKRGFTITSSPFGSAFYTLVGFHGLHVLIGMIWLGLLLIRNVNREVDTYLAPKFYLASLYWHFVDLIWIFVFSIVYLLGKVG